MSKLVEEAINLSLAFNCKLLMSVHCHTLAFNNGSIWNRFDLATINDLITSFVALILIDKEAYLFFALQDLESKIEAIKSAMVVISI